MKSLQPKLLRTDHYWARSEVNGMLTIYSPPARAAEREYIYRVILGEFLGLDYTIIYRDGEHVELTWASGTAAEREGEAASSRLLRMPDVLLKTPDRIWLTSASLPKLPLDRFKKPTRGTGEELLPVIYGKKGRTGAYIEPLNEEGEEGCYLGVDVFGSCLFMLTRYEEIAVQERDGHGRFPGYRSLAWRESFLHRPIVNEYVELLWELLHGLWPELARRKREAAIYLSHDVDYPFYVYGRSRLRMIREVMMDAVRRRDLDSARKKAGVLLRSRRALDQDPFNTFGWLMELSEQAGLRSAFYFITEEHQDKSGIDGNYSIDDPAIQQLLQEIHARGHEIGLHPGYYTFLNPARTRRQFEKLREIAEAGGIHQVAWGGRQHYLRWQAPDTWQFWEDAGLDYDGTLGYADQAGFRCGVCYEFPVFNLKTRRELALRERPLIVMDQTILHPEYMGLTLEQAYETIRWLYLECRKYNGDFTLLWHNSQLVKSSDRWLYRKVVLELLGSTQP
ncbi:polysaccharide deacetylase family protein [Paenibacillus phoenicis]|uniref:Polysaccharide deacetylase family protein n=1 Tax=Paenibacillus phoenicis TaxID=554117 RepID=A0ABU5PQM4_9BACL|nr:MULTISPECIES: polysaccharide deacetylase family protein [Paenibacillus]MCT2194956.1 polysaccharide deacetylase family protein [Paenibacillus sp. p3-SID1389]MEA3572234.1 polysaccharide deacetylase family protein [Paenibacillus phoenicis]